MIRMTPKDGGTPLRLVRFRDTTEYQRAILALNLLYDRRAESGVRLLWIDNGNKVMAIEAPRNPRIFPSLFLHEDVIRHLGAVVGQDHKEICLSEIPRRALAGREGSLTAIINLIVDRYAGIMDEYRPALSDAETRLLRSALARFPHPVESHQFRGLAAALTPIILRSATGAERVQAEALCRRLAAMSYVELVALIDHLERQP